MFSIVATETSVLTFISVPGLAYRGDWSFLQLAFGYIFGRIIVAQFLLPIYFENGVVSIYELVGQKYGTIMQKIASCLFLITRIFADGIRFLATAVIIQVITGWSIPVAVLLIGFCTLLYSITGGIKTIIWVDFFQFIIYFSGGLIVVYLIISSIAPGILLNILSSQNKINLFDFNGNPLFNSLHFISAFIGGTIFSIASHGTDYMMVQRCLSCKDLKSAKRALIGSGVFVFFQFGLFLLAGSFIYVYFNGIDIAKDREFSKFILDVVPVGLKGIILAGVLSAAMSTLSSSMNSLASSTAIDLLKIKSKQIFKLRLVSIFWGIILMLIALIFDEGDKAIIIIGFKIASYTYGGLLLLFLLIKINKVKKTISVLIGFLISIFSVYILDQYDIAWTWFVLLSTLIGYTISSIVDKLIQLK